MARVTKQLTDTEVKKAKPKDKEYNLSDGDGLMLRIKPNGSKLWLFNYYRPYTKKRANISFGTYPELSLVGARKLRTQAKELLINNIDPKVQRDNEARLKKKSLENTLLVVATKWFEVKKTTVAPKTAQDTWNALNNHVFRYLGNEPITEITPLKVIDTIKPVAAKGSLSATKRLCQRINDLFNWAANTGFIETNPLTGIKAAFEAPTVTHYPTLKPNELPQLMNALSYSSMKLVTRLLIEWQLHTMVRPKEAATAQWQHIDFENACWCIPADVMKMKKPHIVPLTGSTLAILERIKPISVNSDYIFVSNNDPKKHVNKETANMALKRIGFKGRLVAHGLRALASTTLNEQGFDPDIIEAALAHNDDNQVRSAYNRADYLERRRVMMAWWSEHIEQAKSGKITAPINIKQLKVI
jgi:integrase